MEEDVCDICMRVVPECSRVTLGGDTACPDCYDEADRRDAVYCLENEEENEEE